MSQIRPKSILSTVLAALIAIFLTSCEGGENVLPDGFSFNFNPKEVTIPSTGGSATVTFKAPYDWSVESTAEWIQVTPTSGSVGDVTVEISVGVNPARESRTATVSVSLPGFEYTESLKVTQFAWDPSIALSEEALTAPAEGMTATFKVNATNDWSVSSDVDWITLSPEAGGFGETEVTVTFAANPVARERAGVITVAGEGQTASVAVSQAAAEPALDLSAENVEVNSEGDAVTLTIVTTLEWTAVPADEWVTVEPVEGDYGESSVVITIAENVIARERTSSVVFTSGELTVTLPVVQAPAPAWITLSGYEAEFASGAGSLILTVTTNADWTVGTEAEWITLSAESGEPGEAQVTVAVAVNDSPDARSADIVFVAVNETATLKLAQKGRGELGGITGDIGEWGDGGEAEYGRK